MAQAPDPKTLTRAEATRRFVKYVTRYAVEHPSRCGWLLDAGIEAGLLAEEVDINGDLVVQVAPWVDEDQPKERAQRHEAVRKRSSAKRGPRRSRKVVHPSHETQGGPPLQSKTPDAAVIQFRPREIEEDSEVVQEPNASQVVQVRAMASQGHSQRQIAETLGISKTTVQRYLKKAMEQ